MLIIICIVASISGEAVSSRVVLDASSVESPSKAFASDNRIISREDDAFASDNRTISPEDDFYSFHHNKVKSKAKFCNLLDCNSPRHNFMYNNHEEYFKTYNLPENYNIDKIIEDLTTGDGFALLRNAVSQEDVKKLKERVMYYTNNQKAQTLKNLENIPTIENQNHFHGLIWGLLNKGRIFEKLLLHPTIQNISRILMGESAHVLSYTANTVGPGEGGQKPHLDYPYYPSFFSQDHKYGAAMMEQPLALVFVVLITDFTVENGATALMPNSHKNPAFPEDKDEFFNAAIQVEGKAGDILAVRSSVQHCAMPNTSGGVRSGILIHMGPVFIRPYENIPDSLEQDFKNRASQEMRTVLGLDNPFPRLKD